MQNLIEQERFEMEVLDQLNTGKFLRSIVFEGGTMLRLCHGLDRFSVDLDFYMRRPEEGSELFSALNAFLSGSYDLRDAAEKHFTILFELRSTIYPRSLKIEIRKEAKPLETERAIAFSPYSTRQVLVNVVTLQEMMKSKLKAFLNRGEIRDIYDMEFLYKRGMKIVADRNSLDALLRRIDALGPREYSVKLGSLLPPDKRSYYIAQNFRVIRSDIIEQLSNLTG